MNTLNNIQLLYCYKIHQGTSKYAIKYSKFYSPYNLCNLNLFEHMFYIDNYIICMMENLFHNILQGIHILK